MSVRLPDRKNREVVFLCGESPCSALRCLLEFRSFRRPNTQASPGPRPPTNSFSPKRSIGRKDMCCSASCPPWHNPFNHPQPHAGSPTMVQTVRRRHQPNRRRSYDRESPFQRSRWPGLEECIRVLDRHEDVMVRDPILKSPLALKSATTRTSVCPLLPFQIHTLVSSLTQTCLFANIPLCPHRFFALIFRFVCLVICLSFSS